MNTVDNKIKNNMIKIMNKIYLTKNTAIVLSIVFLVLFILQAALPMYSFWSIYTSYLLQGEDITKNPNFIPTILPLPLMAIMYLSLSGFFGSMVYLKFPVVEIKNTEASKIHK
jgi:hypothetical protein